MAYRQLPSRRPRSPEPRKRVGAICFAWNPGAASDGQPQGPAAAATLLATLSTCPYNRLSGMLTQASAQRLLEPFGLELTDQQINQVLAYLELLLRWNRRINLTAVRSPGECLTRHFGESLYLSRFVELRGRLLDIGSGAGFPGLVLKIASPQLSVTLLEPTAKKRAFLKEVARACGIENLEVRAERLEQFAPQNPGPWFEIATARAVGSLAQLVPQASQCLKPRGRLCLWVSRRQASSLASAGGFIDWLPPIPLPLGREREIWVGRVT